MSDILPTPVSALRRGAWFCCALVTLGLITTGTATGRAQSVTGRTRPAELSEEGRGGGAWVLGAGVGFMTSGDLFTVVVPSGTSAIWQAPGGGIFNAYEFTVTLDEDVQTGLYLARPVLGRWWLRLDFSWSQMDMTAEARIAQTVELHRYDRLTVLMGGLSVERELVRARHFPYVLGGVALVNVGAKGMGDLDQSLLGWRLGGGFQYTFDAHWAGRFEIRDTIQQLDFSEHRPRTITGTTTPAIEFEQLGPQNFFELTFSIRGIF
jgi:hypothetical protein